MTIGSIARSRESVIPNEDFLTLKRVRDEVAKEVGIPSEELELSMGMSEDFEQAVDLGASNVRYGSDLSPHLSGASVGRLVKALILTVS